MAGSLKRFIQQQLKENVPLAEIKKDLQEKGYGIEMINKAVREAIGGMDRKLHSSTIIQIGVLIVGVVIAIGVAVYLTSGGYKTTQSPPEQNTFLQFCNKYPVINGEISCQNAIIATLQKYSGNIEFVDKIEVPTRTGEQKLSWMIGLNFSEPITLYNVSRSKINVTVDMVGNVLLYKLGG